MNIGIYNTYFESEGIGGGERYMLAAAMYWAGKHRVTIITDNSNLLKLAKVRFGLDLDSVHVEHNFFADTNVLKKALLTKKFDLLFYLTDGSIPTSLAKYNVFHVQVPFPKLPLTFLKHSGLTKVVCNSEFTRDNLDPAVRSKCVVVYPPVDGSRYQVKSKDKVILSVGRFNTAKKQSVLIDTFIDLTKRKEAEGWKLLLAGGLMRSDENYFASLRKKAKGQPVEFFENIPLAKMIDLYAHASHYWHAAGFGETNPMNMEHFGMSTVEAMASGCIPLVFAGGGQPEIVESGVNGYLWNTTSELLEKSLTLISQKDTKKMRHAAIIRANQFSVGRFYAAMDGLLESL